MTEPIIDLPYIEYDGTAATTVTRPVIAETPWVLYVNRRELLTMMCSPVRLHCLALGFLLSEGFISGIQDVWQMRVFTAPDRVYTFFPDAGLDEELHMRTCEEAIGSIDVRLRHDTPARPEKRILTSGCGGGLTFDDLSGDRPPLTSAVTVTAERVCSMMRHLHQQAGLYSRSRGVHTSGLYNPATGQQLVMAEDVGRHNTLDKIRGECLLAGIDTTDCALVTSGRISTEMIGKARKMGVPLVISRTSPTVTSIRLAREWNMTLVGYVRGRRLRVYHGEERIQFAPFAGWPTDRDHDD